ncbi:hypothetical protein QF000_007354 [Paraburkholderia atlantica]
MLVRHCPRLDPVGQLDDAPRGREDQREHGIGGRFGQHVRRVCEHDAAAREVVDVELVVADRDRRQRLQPARAFEHRRRDLHARADAAVGIAQCGDERIML